MKLLVPTVLLISLNLVSGLNLELSAYVQKYLPLTEPEVVQHYGEYAYNIIRDQPWSQHEGIIMNQFGIGQSLAVVNENVVLNVSSSGIEDVLKIGCHKVTPAYRMLVQKLTEDPNTSIYSTIYTQEQDVYMSPGLGKLSTFVNLVDMTKDETAYVDFINAEIQWKSKIKIPVPFFQTEGLSSKQLHGEYVVNIFNYEAAWSKPWTTNDPPASFFSLNKTVPVQFMTTEGFYDLYEDDNYILVRIPLPGGKKNLILIKSNIHYVELLKSGHNAEEWGASIDRLWNNFITTASKASVSLQGWAKRFTNVQLPVLKQILAAPVIRQRLRDLGLNKTLCPTASAVATSRTNFMEQFGQINSFEFNPQKISIASVTGTKNIGSVHQEQSRRRRRRSPIPAATPVGINEAGSNRIPIGEKLEPYMAVFDQPFYWSLEDVQVGPVVTGGVLIAASNSKGDDPAMTNLPTDYMKQYLIC